MTFETIVTSITLLGFVVFVGVDYALLLSVEETIGMILDDSDGGPVLELSLHYVEIIVESPGHVGHSQEEDLERPLLVLVHKQLK